MRNLILIIYLCVVFEKHLKEPVLLEALIIVGLRSDAERLLEVFSWGEEFQRLNEEAFAAYSAVKTARELRGAEAALLERWRLEAEERRAQEIDLPPEAVRTFMSWFWAVFGIVLRVFRVGSFRITRY